MSATSFHRQPSFDFGEQAALVSTAMTAGERPGAPAPVPANTVVNAAQRAVNAVLETTERFAAGGAAAVNLRFAVAGSDLMVRVELRGGEVHATFRTDSTELRTALAQEWQAVSGSEAGAPLRAIEPVFSSAKSSGFGAASGESAPQQHRDPEARQPGEPAHRRFPGQPAPSSFPISDPAAHVPRLIPLGTVRRLDAFA